MFEEQVELGRVKEAVALLQAAVAALEPGCLRGADAAALVEVFSRGEKVCAAGRALAFRRVDESGTSRRRRHRSAAHFLAATTGTSLGQAVSTLEVARRLEHLPATDQAFRSGTLSEVQAREVTAAAHLAPEAEAGLVEAAATHGVVELRRRCRAVAASAQADEAGAYERIRRSRYLRHWSDPDGAVRLDARLTPDHGARLLAAVEAGAERAFKQARAQGRGEPYHAHRADALIALSDAGGAGVPAATVHVRVDHEALRRGHAEPGETCEIDGIGPIPVAAARRLADDAILKVLVTDGADVKAVAHAGRTIPARLRTALQARDPVCVVPGCEVSRGLEIDHRVPLAEGGSTTLDNLARLCGWHHYLKSHRGHRLGGGPGRWSWSGPVGSLGGEGEGRAPPYTPPP